METSVSVSDSGDTGVLCSLHIIIDFLHKPATPENRTTNAAKRVLIFYSLGYIVCLLFKSSSYILQFDNKFNLMCWLYEIKITQETRKIISSEIAYPPF
jgi:hypothetical protein